MADITPYRQFHIFLVPDSENTVAVNAVEQNPELKEASDSYKAALKRGNPEEIKGVIYNLATKFANTPEYAGYGFNPDAIQDSFLREQPLTPQVPNAETPPPQGPSLSDFRPRGGGNTFSRAPEDPNKKVKDKLYDAQKKATLEAFEKLLNETNADPQAIENFYREHFSAAGLLGNQYEILLAQVKKLYGNTDEFQKHPDALSVVVKEKEEKIKKLKDIHTFGPLPSEEDYVQRDTETGNVKNLIEYAKKVPREEVLKKAGGFFDDEWDRRKGEAADRIVQALRNAGIQYKGDEIIDVGANIFQTTSITQSQEVSNEESQETTGGTYGRSRQGGGGKRAANRLEGVAKKAAKQVAKRAIKQGEKQVALGVARAGITAVAGATSEFWVPVLIILGIVVGIAILVFIFIVVVLPQIQQSNNSIPANLPPSCSPGIICYQKLQAIGITVDGDLSDGGDPYGRTKETYDTIALISQAPSLFGQLLKLPQQPIRITYHSGGCAGHASYNGHVDIYGHCLTDTDRFMLTHELSHEIAFRNPDLINKFYNSFPFLLNPVGRVPFPFIILPTYNCQLDYGPGGPFPGECFADTIGEYPVYHTYRNTVSGPFGIPLPLYVEQRSFETFKGAYANYYNFAKDNVYGGLAF